MLLDMSQTFWADNFDQQNYWMAQIGSFWIVVIDISNEKYIISCLGPMSYSDKKLCCKKMYTKGLLK